MVSGVSPSFSLVSGRDIPQFSRPKVLATFWYPSPHSVRLGIKERGKGFFQSLSSRLKKPSGLNFLFFVMFLEGSF